MIIIDFFLPRINIFTHFPLHNMSDIDFKSNKTKTSYLKIKGILIYASMILVAFQPLKGVY